MWQCERRNKKMHLRQPGFTYNACGAFTNSNERIQKLKETGDSRYTYQKKLDKACFQHDMDYGDFEDLNRETAADKVLRDEAFNFVKNPQYDEYLRRLASIVYIFFDKKISGETVKTKIISNRELEEELHKPIIRKFNKRKIYSPFVDKTLAPIWQICNWEDLGFCYVLLRFMVNMHGLFLKRYAFQKIIDESNRKPNKMWVDKGSEFYNRSMKSLLQNGDIDMYSTHNEEKSVVAETIIRALENKIYKCMTSISKNVNIDKLDDIMNKYNNTYHNTIKMKPADVRSNTYTVILSLIKKLIIKIINLKLVILL